MPRPGLRLRLRPALHAVHRWAGLVTGLVLLVMAGTGGALLFMDAANWRGHRPVSPQGIGVSLAPALAQAAAAHPDHAVTNVLLPRSADRAWIILLRHPATDDRIIADVDPYSGALLGFRDFDRTPFRVLLDLHYTLFAGAAGKIVTTVMGVVLVVLALTGLWIYRGAIRGLFHLPGRRSWRQGGVIWLHKWTGLWALAFCLLWGVTGVLQMLTILPATFSRTARFTVVPAAELAALADTAAMVSRVKAAVPDAEIVSFAPPRPGRAEVRFVLLRREAWPWNKRIDVIADARTGALTRLTLPADAKPVDRFNATVHALHFGFQSPTRTLALYVLGALLVVSLPVTGAAIWWLRQARTKSKPGG